MKKKSTNFVISWWNSDINQPTMLQSTADQIHMESKEIKNNRKKKKFLSYCSCTADIISHFVRNAKNNREQQNILVNTINEGTELQIFWPESEKKCWLRGKIIDFKWKKNQPYHLVKWIDWTEEPKWLHLDHYILRDVQNQKEKTLDRSVYLLKAAGWRENNQKMEIDEEEKAEPMQVDAPQWKEILAPRVQKVKHSTQKQATIKPRNNLGDARRKWCPVKTCKYHGGKGLVNRKTHFKTHAIDCCNKSPWFL